MNHWPFIIASYTIVLLGAAVLIAYSYASMRRLEKQTQELKTRK